MSQARVALSTDAISFGCAPIKWGRVVDISDAVGRLGRSLIADRSLARHVARDRVENRTRRQGSTRVVEVENVGHTGRVRSE
jgi:hypothetical protein